MADNDVLIQIRGDVSDINAKLADLSGYIGKVSDANKKMGEQSKGDWALLSAGIAGVIYTAGQAIEKIKSYASSITGLAGEYGKAEQSGLKLNAVLTAHNVGYLTEDYKKYTLQVQEATGIEHEQIESLQAVISTMGVAPKQMQDVIQASIMLHRVFGIDLQQAAEKVAMAMEGNFRPLQKLIPQLKGAETGAISAAQVLKTLQDAMGGVNEQMNDSYLAQIEKMNAQWKEFKETTGEQIVPALREILHLITEIVKEGAEFKKKGGISQTLTKMALSIGQEYGGTAGEELLYNPYADPGEPLSDERDAYMRLQKGNKDFKKSPSHLLDNLRKQWREESPKLISETSDVGLGSNYVTSIDSIIAQADKLREKFKQLKEAKPFIDAWQSAKLTAEEEKSIIEGLQYEIDETVRLREERKKIYDGGQQAAEYQLQKGLLNNQLSLNEAKRDRERLDITENQYIQAQLDAAKQMLQLEMARQEAMNPGSEFIDAKRNEIDVKLQYLRNQLKITDNEYAAGQLISEERTLELERARLLAMDPSSEFFDANKWNEITLKIKEAEERIKDLQIEVGKSGSLSGLTYGLKQYGDEATNTFKNASDFAKNSFKTMNDALVEFNMTGKFNFADFANSIIRDLARIAYQVSITGPFSKAASNYFSNLFSTPSNQQLGYVTPSPSEGVFHDGGVVGGLAARYRLSFNTDLLPRRHSGGLAPDERLTVNKVGERYITEEQNSWLTGIAQSMHTTGSAMPNITVVIENKSGTQMDEESRNVRFDANEYVANIVLKKASSSMEYRNALASLLGGGR